MTAPHGLGNGRRNAGQRSEGADIHIREDDLSGEPVRALLARHLAGMRAESPPGHAFALDMSGLKAPGVGALRMLGSDRAEIKSMRTHPDHLRQGVADHLLRHMVREARARGVVRLSLETGSGPAFEPALALYRRHGFTDGEAFAGYVKSDFNRFLHRDLRA